MKLNTFITCITLFLTSAAFGNTSYVYCGLPDGSDWEWLLDGNDNYETIEGQWARVTEINGQYFNVFRVDEAIYNAKVFNCLAGYVPQPAESGTSQWEIFEIIKPDGSSYWIDSYKTYYSLSSHQAVTNLAMRIL